jgi:glycosyltransferase involved in cell wall biosynthesis
MGRKQHLQQELGDLRLLLVNFSSRRIAGTEIYLEDVLGQLTRSSVDVAFLAEHAEPKDRAQISMPEGVPLFHRLEEAHAWKPNVALVNGRISEQWEEEITQRYPSAYFIHNFYGTCISGLKRHQRPAPEPCFRTLGWACLGLYLPRGCGGSSPLTMIQLYRREKSHQERLRHYGMLITHSEHMREEYIRHGFADQSIQLIPMACLKDLSTDGFPVEDRQIETGPLRIFFAGRMEGIKGGAELIAASSQWVQASGREVELTMGGDGEKKGEWMSLAQRCQQENARLKVAFPGWLSGAQVEDACRRHHLYAMPSLWPEPFGKGGIEAARWGCPAIGFHIGGIPQWLRENWNGHLADWRGNRIENLANAIGQVFRSPEHYRSLVQGALQRATEFTAEAHCNQLLPLLARLRKEKA